MDPPAKIILELSLQRMKSIMETNPYSSLKFIKIQEAIFAHWRVFRNFSEDLKLINWKEMMGRVRNQGGCDSCWAVVTAELVSALLFIQRINKEYVEYSAQDLLDFVDPEKAKTCNRENHYCYTSSIGRGLSYVLKEGLQKETDRPYDRCRPYSEIPERIISELAYIDEVKSLTFEQALQMLQTQPIGASLHIFMPDYLDTGKGIYRGPMLDRSAFLGMHAVSVIGVGEENGEKYFLVKSTHGNRVGEEGYLKVSMEVMLLQVPESETESVCKRFVKPTPLITDFRCPIVHAVGSPMRS